MGHRSIHRRRLHQLENWFLKSHTAKVLALAKAGKQKGSPLDAAKLDIMASALSCWEDPIEPAVLYFKKKKSGGVRPIFRYGIMRAAQQYMAVGMGVAALTWCSWACPPFWEARR